MRNRLLSASPWVLATVAAWGTSTALQAQSIETVFNSMASGANAGYSSSDLNSQYGAVLSLSRSGTLAQVGFSLYNHALSGGSISAGTMTVSVYDASSGYSGGAISLPLLGTLSIPMDLTASPLPAGSYTTFLSGDLRAQGISLTPNILVTQQFQMTSGSSTRYGIATSYAQPTVGSSTGRYQLSNTQNAASLYSSPGGGNVFPLYQVSVVPEPESAVLSAGIGLLGWVAWRRRQASKQGS